MLVIARLFPLVTGGVCRDEISGADFGQEEERVGHNTGGEYQVTSRAN